MKFIYFTDMEKKNSEKELLKLWLRRVAIAAAILMFIVVVSTIWLNVYTRHGERFMVPSYTGMTLEEATTANGEMNVQFEVVDSIYIEGMAPGVILDQHPRAGNFIKSGRRITVTTNTHAPKNVKIPYVTGYSLRQAKSRLISSGLQIGKLIYVEDIATNNIIKEFYNGIEITPNSNKTVPVNSEITLYVGIDNSQENGAIKVPNLIGEILYVAKDNLWEEGINIEISENDNLSRAMTRKATIYKQYPLPGDYIRHGGTISVSVSSDSTKINNGKNRFKDREGSIKNLRMELERVQASELITIEDSLANQLIVENIKLQLDSLTR